MSSVPVIINNRNWLTAPKAMTEKLISLGTEKVIIVDNASTYPPLLEWYESVKNHPNIKLYLEKQNHGFMGGWQIDLFAKEKIGKWFFYTDPDMELNPNMPHDYATRMIEIALRHDYHKIALAYRVDDIPDYFPMKQQAIQVAGEYWKKQVEKDVYVSEIDTTFALYDGDYYIGKEAPWYRTLSVAGGFTARHLGFYIDPNNMTEEEKYYLDHVEKLTFWSKRLNRHRGLDIGEG